MPYYGKTKIYEVTIMKNIINLTAVCAVMGIGMSAGYWLWENVLEDKADKLKDTVTKKLTKNEGA